MKRFLVFVTCLVMATSTFAGPGGEKKELKRAGKKVHDQYIVVFHDRVSDVENKSWDLASKHGGLRDHVYKNTIKGFSVKMNEKRALAMLQDPDVAYIQEDGEVQISASQTGATWGIDRIDQRDLPLNQIYNYDTTASNVTAYIIDTGVRRTHAQFGGRVRIGYDAIGDGQNTNDCNGHGTHVAGTVGGSTYGVAKSVNLVAVRVLNCAGSGTDAGVIAGIDWVTGDHAAGAPAVANMSLGGGASTALDDAVRRSISDGVTYALASGNDNVSACNSSPARVAEGITVNSSTSTDARSSFSNYGTCTDIFAPGSSILSAWYSSDTATNTISGTSMATPHVAGVAALYLANNTSASPAAVWTAIANNSTLNKITSPGTGSPNRLLYSIFTAACSAPTISSFSPTSGAAGTSVTISGTNFTGASSVKFNGTAASFTVSSATSIAATVPSGATTGPISVTTSCGTATSASSFTVSGGGGTTTQLLANPGFESGAVSWTQTAGVIDSSTSRPSRTGSWKAWLNGYGTAHTDYIYQQITIPAAATAATLSFWVRIDTAETTTSVAYDKLSIQVLNSSGTVLSTLATYSNLNKNTTYTQKSFSLLAYKGQTIRVRFYGTEDGSLQTSFVVDDTALNVTQ